MLRKALIVDDEDDIGLMVSRILTKEGLQAEHVNRIAAAKDKVQDGEYQAYLLDLNLPDGTGFDLIPLIRAQSPNARVIVISAHDGVYEMERVAQEKVHTFIKKPFTKSQIIEAIQGLEVQ
ncbi:Response regulator receiver domain-containing protein [Reichenbachiella faecimaris]|uniref:Response regulator receiver domain-containing protein n=1 Tax=Reichenbachiella faecimaris TaxID=692418 RepID=A0A1W2G7Z6_REIFA|nr:response regulator [Reichenbachiella faecimaris]SMD32797.1 Response regulator receiver domain-containing protein [Reichenbachiella faecimaris]